MDPSWDRHIGRAEQLAADHGSARALLTFYAGLLRAQRDLYQFLCGIGGWQPSGSLERDLAVVRPGIHPFVQAIGRVAPDSLAQDASRLAAADPDEIDAMLVACWRAPSDRQFFAKAILQPYAQRLAHLRIGPVDRPLGRTDNRCPFCGGVPQLSILRPIAEGDTGSRLLQCATCLTTWPFRRVVCIDCGEEDDRKLAYFQSPDTDHVRVDACDTCRHYLKTVDLTRLGIAVPIVDEIAAAPLDVWAVEQGYRKIELNLVGL
jgi:FdhE protein